MENKKQVVGSSSSFTADLFDSKESTPPSSSTGIFASIFATPSPVVRRNYSRSELDGCLQQQSTRNEVGSTKQVTAEMIAEKSEDESSSMTKTESRSIFQERVETCPLSSSLYYGGLEDMYICSSNSQSSGSYPTFKNDGMKDDPYGNDSQIACRGNWWQGKTSADTATKERILVQTSLSLTFFLISTGSLYY